MGKNYGVWNFKRRVEKKVVEMQKFCRAQIAGGDIRFLEVAMGLRYVSMLLRKVNDGKFYFILENNCGEVVGKFETERDAFMSEEFAHMINYRVKIVYEYECGVVAKQGEIDENG